MSVSPPPGPPSVPSRCVLILTGLSGSGKSTAIHALEDLGFYCIDNLPVTLVPQFLSLRENSHQPIGRVGLGITGHSPEVAAFVLACPEAKRFLAQLSALLVFSLPLCVREGKSYLTLTLGCMGGRHRSVSVAEELGRRLADSGYSAHIRHRDQHR